MVQRRKYAAMKQTTINLGPVVLRAYDIEKDKITYIETNTWQSHSHLLQLPQPCILLGLSQPFAALDLSLSLSLIHL